MKTERDGDKASEEVGYMYKDFEVEKKHIKRAYVTVAVVITAAMLFGAFVL